MKKKVDRKVKGKWVTMRKGEHESKRNEREGEGPLN